MDCGNQSFSGHWAIDILWRGHLNRYFSIVTYVIDNHFAILQCCITTKKVQVAPKCKGEVMRSMLKSALVAATIIAAPMVVQAETVIRVTLQLPETHSLGQNWMAFKDIIEEKSGGELTVQLFPSAQLFKDKEVPGAVGSGAIEAGSAFLGRFTGAVPAVDVVNLPFIFRDEAHLRASVATGSPMRNILDDAVVKETGAKVLWWQAFGRNVYLSNGTAVRTPKDLENKKVRTYGKVLGWTVEALGGAPTLMSGSKQFLAYQQGAVDVGMTGASAVKSRKLHEVMDHMTLSYDSAIEFVAVMNNDFFENLSPEHQQIVLDAASEVEQQLRDAIYAEEDGIVDEMRSQMTVVELSPDERQQWVAATTSVADRFVDDAGDTAARVLSAISKN
jgi:C4-dicarboxylate-binding protein DctP